MRRFAASSHKPATRSGARASRNAPRTAADNAAALRRQGSASGRPGTRAVCARHTDRQGPRAQEGARPPSGGTADHDPRVDHDQGPLNARPIGGVHCGGRRVGCTGSWRKAVRRPDSRVGDFRPAPLDSGGRRTLDEELKRQADGGGVRRQPRGASECGSPANDSYVRARSARVGGSIDLPGAIVRRRRMMSQDSSELGRIARWGRFAC